MEENLFGEPYDTPQKEPQSPDAKKKRRWENRFQRWSNEQGMDGYTHYGCCGFGEICDYCKDNDYGRPCVRALNEMCRTKRKSIDYDTLSFEDAFDGVI